MDDRKHFTFLESASPFVFFTETFSNPKDFRNAKVEFFNNGLNANQRAVLALKYTRTAEVFFKAVFRNKEQMEYFFAGLDERGAVQEYEIALNGELTSNRWCQISSRIIRSNNGEYQLQGFLVSLQRVKELEKTLSEENALLETILSGIGDAVCVYDQNKKIIFQSPLHKKWFDSPEPYMCLQKTKPGDPPGPEPQSDRFVEKHKSRHGTELYLEITRYPIRNRDGELFAGINIVRDLSISLELKAKSLELERIKQDQVRESALKRIIGKSESIRKVLGAVERISQLDTVVFIQGETGTGKELIARAIYELSPRATKPFVTINCGALTETLLDAELFGHTKGAFTGAEKETTGLFEAADGGTIFLDEIGEMSMGTQVKLLRVLQDGEIRKLGSSKSKKVNVRVITATNRDIEKMVREKKFRQDLFYRIHVFTIRTPTLKEREGDLLLLADYFLEKFSTAQNKKIRRISRDAAFRLRQHDWPGNIRELRNVIERATILCERDTIEVGDLPLFESELNSTPKVPVSIPMDDDMEKLSKRKILACLEKNRWNKTMTAKDLNVSRATLWRKLKEFSLSSP